MKQKDNLFPFSMREKHCQGAFWARVGIQDLEVLQGMDSIYQFDRGSVSRVAGILIGWVLLTQKGIDRSRKRLGAILAHDDSG